MTSSPSISFPEELIDLSFLFLLHLLCATTSQIFNSNKLGTYDFVEKQLYNKLQSNSSTKDMNSKKSLASFNNIYILSIIVIVS